MTKGIRDFTSGYRLYDKKTIEKFFLIIGNKYRPAAGFEMQLEILLKLRKTNVNFFEIPINLNYKNKPTGSKMNIIKTILNYLILIILRIFNN
jgi:dolichol-phosphate mannosyltransferase